MRIPKAAILLTIIASGAPDAHAAGFAIFEQGARGMGMAGANTANPKDASAIFHNAAGIAFLKQQHLYLGGTLVHPTSTFTGDDPSPGAGVIEKGDVGIIPVPSLYYTRQVSEKTVVGFGLHSPFGLATRWANPDTFTGRFLSVDANLKTLSLNPTVAYRLRDRLAIGGGLDLRASRVSLLRHAAAAHPTTKAVLDVADLSLEGNWSWGMGFNAGFIAKPTENLSLGAAYRHKVRVDYAGQATYTQRLTGDPQLDPLITAALPQAPQATSTQITFPAIANCGVAYEKNEWTFAGDVVFYQWSTFDELAIDFTATPGIELRIPENYKNSFQARLGVERVINEWWEVRGGYFFDQTPSPASSMSPLLPDASRHGLALGGSFVQRNWRLDAGLWYVAFRSRSTAGTSRDSYNGTYDNAAVTLSASVAYQF